MKVNGKLQGWVHLSCRRLLKNCTVYIDIYRCFHTFMIIKVDSKQTLQLKRWKMHSLHALLSITDTRCTIQKEFEYFDLLCSSGNPEFEISIWDGTLYKKFSNIIWLKLRIFEYIKIKIKAYSSLIDDTLYSDDKHVPRTNLVFHCNYEYAITNKHIWKVVKDQWSNNPMNMEMKWKRLSRNKIISV